MLTRLFYIYKVPPRFMMIYLKIKTAICNCKLQFVNFSQDNRINSPNDRK